MLSPAQRQVAHALLTRPPLTFIRSKLPNQSVRLECVKHAASVHPEPGSNSLKKIKNFQPTVESSFTLEVWAFALYFAVRFPFNDLSHQRNSFFFTFREKELYEYLFFLFLVFRCSIFKVHTLFLEVLFAFRKACLLYHIFLRLSSTFWKFFQLFSSSCFPFALFRGCRFAATFVLYHKVFRLSRGFRNFLEVFSTSYSLYRLSKFPLAFGDLLSIAEERRFVKHFLRFFRIL